jgi:hypothetical protein
MHTRNRIRAVVAMAMALSMVFANVALASVTPVGLPVSANGSTASTLTLNAPALDAGDVLLAQIVAAQSFTTSDTICPPAGWTSIERVTFEGKIVQEIFTYSTSSTVAATGHTWQVRNSTCSGSPSSDKGMSGGLLRYAGVTETIDGSRIAGGSSTTATAPAVTTTRNDAYVVRFFAAFKSLTFGGSPLYNVGSANASSVRTAAAYHAPQATAGSTGTFAASMSESAEWVATTVALQGVVIPVADSCAGRTSPGAPTITASNNPAASTWYNATTGAAKFTISPSANAEYKVGTGAWTTYNGEVTLPEGEHSVVARNFLAATGTCTRIDGADSSATSFKVDTIAPNVQPADIIDTIWRKISLSQAFTSSDSGSGLANSADANFTLTASEESTTGAATTDSKTVTDRAGNSTTRTLSAKIDKYAPTVAVHNASGTAGNLGWYKSDVTVTFRATDSLSGFAGPSTTEDRDVTSSGQGSSVTVTSPAFTDLAGNTVAAGNQTPTYKIDKDGPVVSCGSAPATWSASDVSIACTAEDDVSGLAESADASFALITNVSAGSETANALTNYRNVADVAGHSSPAGPLSGIKVDKKAPANITFDGAPTTVTQGTNFPNVTCDATDGGSGLASCTVTGQNNSDLGERTLTATAIDKVGNRSTAERTYQVVSAPAAPPACSATADWHGAVKPAMRNQVQAGRVVPVQIQVTCDGAPVTGLTPSIRLVTGDQDPEANFDSPTSTMATVSSADTGGIMRASSSGYIYNLQLPSIARAGDLFTIAVRHDGTSHAQINALVQIRK